MRIFDSLGGSVLRIFEKTHNLSSKNTIFQENVLKTRVLSRGSRISRDHLGLKNHVFFEVFRDS